MNWHISVQLSSLLSTLLRRNSTELKFHFRSCLLLSTCLYCSDCYTRLSQQRNRAGGRTPRTGGRGREGGSSGLIKNCQFLKCFQPPHNTKSWLHHWILFINMHSAVSQIQSIRQIMPLSLNIPMLKNCQLQGGFAPLTPWPGALPLDHAGGSAPDPRYILNTGPQLYLGASNSLAPALRRKATKLVCHELWNWTVYHWRCKLPFQMLKIRFTDSAGFLPTLWDL